MTRATRRWPACPCNAPPRAARRPALLLAGLALSITSASLRGQDFAVRGDTIYTMSGAPLRDGVIVIRDSKIVAVGPAATTPIPPGVDALTASVVTPGLIDGRGVVGVSGIFNTHHDQSQLERSEPLQPELRALDAYNPHDPLVAWVRGFGVTSVHTGHAPGELISGQTFVTKTWGNTVNDALLREMCMVAATLDPAALKGDAKSPGTRGKAAAMLRSELIKAREYIDKLAPAPDGKQPERSLRLEALARVLKREAPLLITADRAQDIHTALRLAKEFNIAVVLDSAAEAYLMLDDIKAAGVAVLLHPSMQRAVGDRENQSFETAARLKAAGIPFAIESGYESYVPKTRVALFEAALAAANGLTFEQALASITIDAARILGVDTRVGSLEPGKDADLALYDGDPFEYTTHCVGVIINGQVVSREPR